MLGDSIPPFRQGKDRVKTYSHAYCHPEGIHKLDEIEDYRLITMNVFIYTLLIPSEH